MGNQVTRTRHKNFKKNMLDLKREHGGNCAICKYDKCLEALDFHHIDPSTKDSTYHAMGAILRNCSLQKAKEEAKKCVLICCRCHREIHAGIISIPAYTNSK